jgi:predicted hydrocarbon binding protein
LRIGAKTFSDLFNKHTDQRVRVEEKEDKILWHIERCPLCWGRTAEEPVCHLAVGLLQESLYWVSGGKVFSVEETACIAKGDPACTIVIGQTPLS